MCAQFMCKPLYIICECGGWLPVCVCVCVRILQICGENNVANTHRICSIFDPYAENGLCVCVSLFARDQPNADEKKKTARKKSEISESMKKGKKYIHRKIWLSKQYRLDGAKYSSIIFHIFYIKL